jgi:hypothetical protein
VAKNRKQSDSYSSNEEKERGRHGYKAAKTLQNKKMMKDLDKVLRSKDYSKLATYDNY